MGKPKEKRLPQSLIGGGGAARQGEPRNLLEAVREASLAVPPLRVPKVSRGVYAAYQVAEDVQQVHEKLEEMRDLLTDAQKRAFYQELVGNLREEAKIVHEESEYYYDKSDELRIHAIMKGKCHGFL